MVSLNELYTRCLLLATSDPLTQRSEFRQTTAPGREQAGRESIDYRRVGARRVDSTYGVRICKISLWPPLRQLKLPCRCVGETLDYAERTFARIENA
jgi:hypothetical protein